MFIYLLIIGAILWFIFDLSEIKTLLKTINKQLDYVNVKLWSELNSDDNEEED